MKKNDKPEQRAILTWKQLAARGDLVGARAEIFRDCSFDAMLHQFTRGTVTEITWRGGKPARIFITDAVCCQADKNGLSQWQSSAWDCIQCSTGKPPGPFEKKSDDLVRKHAWTKDKVIFFATADHAWVVLYPKGVTPGEAPFFYRTAEQFEVERDQFVRQALQSLRVTAAA